MIRVIIGILGTIMFAAGGVGGIWVGWIVIFAPISEPSWTFYLFYYYTSLSVVVGGVASLWVASEYVKLTLGLPNISS